MGKNNDEYVPKRYGRQDALDDFDSIDKIPSFLPSSVLKVKEEKDKKEKEIKEVENTYSDDEWLATLSSLKTEKKSKKADLSEIFGDKKKKKKKKKKQGEIKDYKEDFEKELTLLQSLLHDQTKLSDSLQSRYDQLSGQKTASRGVGKFTTDLIDTLNTSRRECKDILKEIINTKKTIADLNMKEREKFAKNLIGDDSDLSNFASSYLSKLLSVDRKELAGEGSEIEDIDDLNDAFGDLDFNLRNSEDYTERSEEAEKYMKYEGVDVKTKVFYDKEADDIHFFAEDRDGNIIDDYPLPDTIDSLRINESTGIAVDSYGQRFEVIQV